MHVRFRNGVIASAGLMLAGDSSRMTSALLSLIRALDALINRVADVAPGQRSLKSRPGSRQGRRAQSVVRRARTGALQCRLCVSWLVTTCA